MLNEFQERICDTDLGCVRVCADDVGCALRSIISLHICFDIFSHAQSFACLVLKPAKCFLVPLSRALPRSLNLTTVTLQYFSLTAESADIIVWCGF